ncbi:helix-turn-helix domain-containing protein [Streptomyces sp. SP18BB07]|uniref:helix-turn-helix domain-containing protein n=1 Tax=Streptomyces sp. SP18BB07 TaxID=3002522 RepID=UPI002E77A4E8|nr:helix-turn-helix transcriptional regulator [Streptomyces sp. SP18BB07]MEE1763670.1 helix-turn-helix transcriptional regulator [Streptomyces sp. SP18BB07]
MENQRQSTPANAEAAESVAARLPSVLAMRLKGARVASGMSQQAVAEAMVERGFKWRQSTVAKSESGDRPVLFSEVAALSAIYRKDLDYFRHSGGNLDELIDALERQLSDTRRDYQALLYQVQASRSEIVMFECVTELAQAIRQYRDTGDEFDLDVALRDAFHRHGYMCFSMPSLYEAVGIDQSDIENIDSWALRKVASNERRRHRSLSEEELMEESGMLLNSVAQFLDGEQVDPGFIASLREGDEWASFAWMALGGLLKKRIQVESEGE